MKKELVEAVVVGTSNNSIVWSQTQSIFNSETSHHYNAKLDNTTNLELEINLDKNLKFDHVGILQVINKELPNGNLYIHRTDVDNKTNDLGEEIYDKYIKSRLRFRAKTEDEILSDIINVIPEAKVAKRDQRIDEILNGVTKTITNDSIIPEKKKHWLWG